MHLIKKSLIEKIEKNVPNVNLAEDKFIQKLINLPDKFSIIYSDKMMSKTRKNYFEIFYHKNYFNILSVDLWLCFKHIQTNNLSNPELISYLAYISGKLSFVGHSGSSSFRQ